MASLPFLAPALAIAGIGTNLIGRGIQARAQRQAGAAAQDAANFEATQLEHMAGQEVAAGQRDAYETERQRDLLSSRQQAVAAASGGGAGDPTVVDLMTDVEREGTYRANMERHTSGQRALGLLAQATATRKSGQASAKGANLAAAGTIIGGIGEAFGSAGSFFNQYGGTQPTPTTTTNNYIYG